MKRKKYNLGGSLANTVDMAAPLLALIPGAQPFAAMAPMVSAAIRQTMPKTSPQAYGSPGNYNTGGDISLSANAFQVKGKPNVTDGNQYMTPVGKINLDHDEVIKNSFVFSDDLKDPSTKKSFAKLALRLEKANGQIEKKLQLDPSNKILKDTLAANNQQLASIASKQETLATAKGLREPTRSFQNGGPTDPWELMKLGLYPSGPSHYNNSAFLWPQGQATAPRERLYPTDGLSTVGAVAGAVEGRIPYYESDVTTKPKPAGRIPGGKTKPATSTSAAAQPVNFMDYTPASMDPWAWNSPAPTIPSTRQPQPPLDYPSVTSTAQRSPLDLNQFMVNTNPAATMTGNSATNPSAYHIGDILQAVEVASKFAQANQKVEVQRPYTDNTPVSRAAYDPSQALYQSSRNFRNSVNSIDTASPNLRRAFANSAYATRMNQDNATISQYDQMNRQGLVDYESRLSNQRRYNNQMNLTVDDINARNRGTQQNAIQNSFTSLGNFGEQLNRKDQATAALNVLKVMYPDIYSRMMTSI